MKEKQEVLGLWQSLMNNGMSQIYSDQNLQLMVQRTNEMCSQHFTQLTY